MPNKYWIGGSGNNWSTAANWSLSSGVVNPTTVPTTADDAYFDANSGTGTVTITAGATAANIYFTNGITGSFAGTLNMATTLTVVNSFTLSPAVGFSVTGTGTLSKTGSGGTLTSNGKTWSGSIQMPSGGGFSTTFGDNWTITGTFNATPASATVITASAMRTITIGGNLSAGAGTTCTNITFVMGGTGTISGTYTGNSIATFVIQINATGTITQNALSISTGTFTYTSATSYTSTATLSVGGLGVTFNNVSGITFSSIAFLAAGGQTITLNSNMNTGALGGGSLTGIINGAWTVFTTGNITPAAGLTGTATIEMIGFSSANISAGTIENNLTINKSGGAAVNITGNLTWGTASRILQRTAGNINPGTSTITIPNAAVTINNMIFNNLTITSGATITQNTLNTINTTLLLSGTATFAGTAGWNTFNFTHGGAGFTCTLQAGITYNVTGLFTMVGTAASRAILQSNDVANVTISIPALSNQMSVSAGSIPNPAAGYVLGSVAYSTALPAALSNILPDRPTIASGSASPYTLVNPIGVTALTAYAGQVGKKAFFNVNSTTPVNVIYAATRDINSSGGVTIYATASFPDDNSASPNLFRTLNWGPLVAPSGSVYYTWVD